MPTSLLYHAFGIQGYQHVSTKFESGKVSWLVGNPASRAGWMRGKQDEENNEAAWNGYRIGMSLSAGAE